MNRFVGKALSVVLSFAMMMTSFSLPVYAEETIPEAEMVMTTLDEVTDSADVVSDEAGDESSDSDVTQRTEVLDETDGAEETGGIDANIGGTDDDGAAENADEAQEAEDGEGLEMEPDALFQEVELGEALLGEKAPLPEEDEDLELDSELGQITVYAYYENDWEKADYMVEYTDDNVVGNDLEGDTGGKIKKKGADIYFDEHADRCGYTVTKVEYKTENDEDYTELKREPKEIKPGEGRMVYTIPAAKNDGSNIEIRLTIRAMERVELSFNDDENSHYIVSKIYDLEQEKPISNTEHGYTMEVDENSAYFFKITPEPGYSILAVYSDEATVEIGKLTSERWNLKYEDIVGLREKSIDKEKGFVKINVILSTPQTAGNRVQYVKDNVTVQIMCGGDVVEPTLSQPILMSDGVWQDFYNLDTTKSYSLVATAAKGGVRIGNLAVTPAGKSCTQVKPVENAHNYNIGNPKDGTLFFVNAIEGYAHFVFKYGSEHESGTTFKIQAANYTSKGKKTTITLSNTSDGGKECFIPVAEDTQVFFSMIGGTGSRIVSGKLANPEEGCGLDWGWGSTTPTTGVRNDMLGNSEEELKARDYIYEINTVASGYEPILYSEDGDRISGVKKSNGYAFTVKRNQAYQLYEVNTNGRYSKFFTVNEPHPRYPICPSIKYPDGTLEPLELQTDTEGNTYVSILEEAVADKYAGKVLSLQYLTDLSGVNATTVTLNVACAITKVTVAGATAKGEITQEVGTEKTYRFTTTGAEKNSADALEIGTIIGNIKAEMVDGQDAIKVTTTRENPTKGTASPYAGTFKIVNSETEQVVATVNVITQAPTWTNTTPTASLDSATPTTVSLKLKAPKGVNINDDSYFYKVRLASNTKTKLKDDYELGNEPHYYPINESLEQIDVFSATPAGLVDGDGCGTSLDAYVSVVQVKDTATDAGEEGNIFLETATAKIKKLTVSTKTPYHADKITLKTTAVAAKLYAGQNNVLVANVDFGKNATFTTTDNWEIESVTDAKGNNYMYNPATPDATSYLKVEKRGALEPVNKFDAGVLVSVGYTIPAGKYKITVNTVPYAAVATLEVTVLPTIAKLGIAPGTDNDYSIYKIPGKAATKQTKVYYAKDTFGNEIKNPKVRYEVGIPKVSGEEGWRGELESVSGLSVDSKGKITVASDFIPSGEDLLYQIRVYANDYSANPIFTQFGFKVITGNVKIDTLKLGYGDREDDTPSVELAENAKMPSGKVLFCKVYNSKTQDENDVDWVKLTAESSSHPSNDPYGKGNLYYEIGDTISLMGPNIYSDENKAPKQVTFKATSVDGSSASASFTLSYSENSAMCTGLRVRTRDEEDYFFDWYYDDVSEIDHSVTINYPSDREYVAYVNGPIGEAFREVVDVKLEISGARIIFDLFDKGLDKGFVMTSKVATIKIKRGNSVLRTLTITNPTFDNPTAPAAKSIAFAGDKKYYRGYKYLDDTEIVIPLNAPIKNSAKEIINPEDVEIETNLAENFDGGELKSVEYLYDSDKKTASIVAKLNGDCYGLDAKTLEFAFYYKDKNSGAILAKNPTIVKVTPSDFKKSFAIKATQTMTKTVYKDGSATYSSLTPAFTATGMKAVTFDETEPLLNYSVKGVFNTFATDYCVKDGQICLNDPESYGTNKSGVPNPADGYVKCHVVFNDGTEKDYINKIKITWKVVKSNEEHAPS